jgi:putative transposase
VQARLGDDAQCLLVIIGAAPEGKKEPVGVIDGVRESARSWRILAGVATRPEAARACGGARRIASSSRRLISSVTTIRR